MQEMGYEKSLNEMPSRELAQWIAFGFVSGWRAVGGGAGWRLGVPPVESLNTIRFRWSLDLERASTGTCLAAGRRHRHPATDDTVRRYYDEYS